MRSMFRSVLVMLVAAFLTMGVGTAMAAETPTYLCVPETAGQTVTSGGSEGKCETKNTKVELPPTAELATLQSILPDIKYVASGVADKPTIQFSGVNMQVVNGEGKTDSVNGEGNLVIGYDERLLEKKYEQTGSHNLVLGIGQTFTSYGGILGGGGNTISGSYASVTGGVGNTASGYGTSVTGGASNTASVSETSVTGGGNNTASGTETSVTGGYKNTASGKYASIFGGKELKAEKEFEAIP